MLWYKRLSIFLIVSIFSLNIFAMMYFIEKDFSESNKSIPTRLRGEDPKNQQGSKDLDPSKQARAIPLKDSDIISKDSPSNQTLIRFRPPSCSISGSNDGEIGIYDSAWDSTDGGNSLSVTLNSNGSNLLALAILSWDNYEYRALVTSVTFNGDPLTHLGTANEADDAIVSIYYLKNPDTGSGLPFTITFNESVYYQAAAWFSILDDVNQTDTFGPIATYNDGTTNDIQVTVSTINGDRVFGAVSGETTGHWFVDTPSTELYSYDFDHLNSAAANGNATGSSYSFHWTSSSADHAAAIGVAIHPIDAPPVINDFGVDDPGTGSPQFWANVTDKISSVANVTIKLNGTSFNMSLNGTGYWVYQPSQVNFNETFNYQISNASDSFGNYILAGSTIKNITFDYDALAPDVLQWKYSTSTNTFRANVSDSWGEVDTVIVNVTYHSKTLPDPATRVMSFYQDFGVDGLGYINDTFTMQNGDIEFRIFVNDTHGNEFLSATHPGVVWINHPPIAENLTLSPSILYSNETLVLNYDYYDEDNHGESGTEIRWYKNGILQASFNDSTQIDHTYLTPGDKWNVTVRPKDGELFGDMNSSTTVTVLNTPPVVLSVTLSPTTAYTTSTLSITNTTSDYENDVLTFYIEWYWNLQHNSSYDNLLTITPDKITKGESWYCRIKAFDGTDNSSWRSSNSITIQNSIPQAVNLTISPSTAYTNDTLVASWDMADLDGDTENKSAAIIYWYKYGELQPLLNNCAIINPGNTSKDQTWFFRIQVFDGTAYSTPPPVQSGTIIIRNSVPMVQNVSIKQTAPLTTEALEADWDYLDIDGDIEGTPIINWFTNTSGSWQQQGSGQILPASATTKGQYWCFGIQVYDQDAYAAEVNSSPVLILNTPPEIANLDLTSNPTTNDDLVATWVDTDNDSDGLTFNIIWYLNGVFNSSWETTGSSATLNMGNTTKTDLWSFTIQAFDGEEYSSIIPLGYNVSILNTAPIVGNLTITTDPTTTDDLVANYDFDDNDKVDLPLIIIIKWYKNGQEQPSFGNTTTINSGNTNKSEIWWFTVQAFDGEAYSPVKESIHREILNSAPVVSNLCLPSSPTTTDDLVATWDETDVDNDELSLTIKWYTNSSGTWQQQASYDDLTALPASATSKGDYWLFSI
ncbi:MAG: hypothetical protein ACFFDC_15875, partial [Promethearchaeota archaeon]